MWTAGFSRIVDSAGRSSAACRPMMTDREALQFLIRKFGADYPTKHHIGAKLAVAESLGISNSALVNWRKRGIPVRSRPVVWRVCNDHGAKLPVDWQIV